MSEAPSPPAVTVVELGESHLVACAKIAARTPLLAGYGVTEASAHRDLGRDLARDDTANLVALGEGEHAPLGYARFALKGGFDRSPYLRLLVVDPEAKGRGVGRTLMQELERRHLAPNGIILLCAVSNPAARAFYEHLGYGRVGVIPSYTGPGLDEDIFFKPAPTPGQT